MWKYPTSNTVARGEHHVFISNAAIPTPVNDAVDGKYGSSSRYLHCIVSGSSIPSITSRLENMVEHYIPGIAAVLSIV